MTHTFALSPPGQITHHLYHDTYIHLTTTKTGHTSPVRWYIHSPYYHQARSHITCTVAHTFALSPPGQITHHPYDDTFLLPPTSQVTNYLYHDTYIHLNATRSDHTSPVRWYTPTPNHYQARSHITCTKILSFTLNAVLLHTHYMTVHTIARRTMPPQKGKFFSNFYANYWSILFLCGVCSCLWSQTVDERHQSITFKTFVFY